MQLNRSDSIAALSAALSKAQAEIEGASKGKVNPHFKSAYADLASVWDACREPLTKNGLAIIQPVTADGATVTVTTILTHSSGEWISSDLPMTATQNTPQGIGSCITYARRYALAAMVGVAPEDDDGNAASQHTGQAALPIAQKGDKPKGYEDWLIDLTAAADEGADALKRAWNGSKPEFRQYLSKHDPGKIESLKAKAAHAEQVPA